MSSHLTCLSALKGLGQWRGENPCAQPPAGGKVRHSQTGLGFRAAVAHSIPSAAGESSLLCSASRDSVAVCIFLGGAVVVFHDFGRWSVQLGLTFGAILGVARVGWGSASVFSKRELSHSPLPKTEGRDRAPCSALLTLCRPAPTCCRPSRRWWTRTTWCGGRSTSSACR